MDNESIPLEEISEARNALADEFFTLNLALEKPSMITRLHSKRIKIRIVKIEQYLSTLDNWIKKVKR